jgi:hypothetical protein
VSNSALDPGANTKQRAGSPGDTAAQRAKAIVERLHELARAELAATLAKTDATLAKTDDEEEEPWR